MAIRVTISKAACGATLKIDGRLQAADLEALTKELSQVEGVTTIDLSDLSSADREAVYFLRELIARGTKIQAATPYVSLLLSTAVDHT